MKKHDNNPTEQQIRIIQLMTPYPYGRGLRQRQIAQILQISLRTVQRDLQRFREQWPDRWDAIQLFHELAQLDKKLSKTTRKNLNNAIQVGALDWGCDPTICDDSILFDGCNDYIVDVNKIAYMKIRRRF